MSESEDKNIDAVDVKQVVCDPFAELIKGEKYIVDDLVEAVIIWAQQYLGDDEFIKAREDFFCRMGKVFEADSFFENRMNYFLDYFVFQRPLAKQGANVSSKDEGKTPFQIFLGKIDQGEFEFDSELIATYRQLANFRHSIFLIKKLKDDWMTVLDMFDGTKFTIYPKRGEIFRGFYKKEIIQTFIFPYGDIAHLSRGIVIHHLKATSTIKTSLKKLLKSPEFDENVQLCRLAQLQLRHTRLPHVAPKVIYSEDPR